MDPSSNFYNYRTALRGATQRSLTAHSSREKVNIKFPRGAESYQELPLGRQECVCVCLIGVAEVVMKPMLLNVR